MIHGDSSESELVMEAAAGSEAAFQQLYRRHHLRVYRFAREMTGSSAMADEITQDVFFILVRQLRQFDPARGQLGSYLLGIARNQTLRVMRRERLYVEIDESAEPGVSPPFDPQGRQELERLREAIRTLPAPYREVVLLCELEELDYAEAARLLECPIGTVRSRLHRARAILMEKCMAERARAKG